MAQGRKAMKLCKDCAHSNGIRTDRDERDVALCFLRGPGRTIPLQAMWKYSCGPEGKYWQAKGE